MSSILTTNTSISPPLTLDDVVMGAFVDGHGYMPYPWQISTTAHILSTPDPVLLVRATGGGKSAVHNTLGLIREGVSLTIVPLLSLGADQVQKLQLMKQNQDLPIFSEH
jgi:hypothetical protein